MKELDGPPANPVKWLVTLKDKRTTIVEAKLWYTALQLGCRQFGISSEQVLHVEHAPEVEAEVGPHLVTPDDFEMAPMYTVFKGPAVDTGIGDGWDIFSIDGVTASRDVQDKASRMGIVVAYDECGMLMQPMWDADVVDDGAHPECANDFKAACAYLNEGGRLVKLPDTPDSKYFRLYPIIHVRHHEEP